METDDPGARRLVLRLAATLVAPVEIKPQPRTWLTAIAGQSAQTVLLLHRHDGKKLKIDNIVINNPELLEAKAEPVTKPENRNGLKAVPGDIWLTIRLKPQQGAVSRGTRVNFNTNVKDDPLIHIPVTIRTRPKVEAVPPRIQLVLPAKGGSGFKQRVHLRDNLGGRMKVLKVTSDHPELFTATLLSTEPSADQVIEVKVTNEAAAQKLTSRIYGRLHVTTDNPDAKELEVPVIIWRRLPRRTSPPIHINGQQPKDGARPPVIYHVNPGKPLTTKQPAAKPAPTPKTK